ncbi:MAG: DUF4197 domain-containing protein [Rhodoferax sp.]|nr:DUF4197 domain-containing protein [Rhodoferax sp.]MCF8209358.1 DUF4197 domain-containing protein [Rhodoferax sp.]
MIDRRALVVAAGCLFAWATGAAAELSQAEASSGLTAAITRGAEFAVSELGKQNGFLGNDRVRIALPEPLRKVESLARTLGMGRQADELVDAMNHAAEQAVVQAKPILLNAAKKMSFNDSREILLGESDAATQYFKRATSAELTAKFLPVVKKATTKVQLAQKYNEFAGQAVKLGWMNEKDADIDTYVTQKTMDGLFVMIAEQEGRIRKDPVGTGSSILKKVFGSLGN